MAKTQLKEVALASVDQHLATPTDLEKKGVAEVAKAVNGLVADAIVLYYKTKNFHWHVSGPHFRDYHKMLDEQAEQIFASVDPLAERVRKLGQRTILGLENALHLTSLEEDLSTYVEPHDMLTRLLADNKIMVEAMRNAHKICDDIDDVATASLLEVYIDETERRIWFLFEATR